MAVAWSSVVAGTAATTTEATGADAIRMTITGVATGRGARLEAIERNIRRAPTARRPRAAAFGGRPRAALIRSQDGERPITAMIEGITEQRRSWGSRIFIAERPTDRT
jgi:hypothetical protein